MKTNDGNPDDSSINEEENKDGSSMKAEDKPDDSNNNEALKEAPSTSDAATSPEVVSYKTEFTMKLHNVNYL